MIRTHTVRLVDYQPRGTHEEEAAFATWYRSAEASLGYDRSRAFAAGCRAAGKEYDSEKCQAALRASGAQPKPVVPRKFMFLEGYRS